jgi:hypothetical protein
MNRLQGDQIGRIFAHWAIVFFVQCFKLQKYGDFCATFFSFLTFSGKSDKSLTKKWDGQHFGRFFRKLTCSF